MAVLCAYRRWSSGVPHEAEPFTAYLTALDREESTAVRYAEAVGDLQRRAAA